MASNGLAERAAEVELEAICDPMSGQGLVSAGRVQGLVIEHGQAGFVLEVPASQVSAYAEIRAIAEAALQRLPGITKAQVVLTAAASPGTTRVRRGAKLTPDPKAVPDASQATRPAHVRRVLAVASGKGGVGKSTIAVNIACQLAKLGQTVGLLDADIYGPSGPRMMGLDGEPTFVDGKLQPLSAHGVKVMSIGFLVDDGAAMIWRGPMASSAVRQMLHDVAWGDDDTPMDTLVIDLPPGTGDILLTMTQKVQIDGVIVVTTPQEVALIDVRRSVDLFHKTRTPILGIVETLSWYLDPASETKVPIFGSGGGAAEARRLGVPLLAEIPIEAAIREAGDVGIPVTAGSLSSPGADALRALGRALI